MHKDGEDCYFVRDHLGSVRLVIDSNCNIVEQYEYSTYGELTIKNGSGQTISTSSFGNRHTYTGREWDENLGLYYYRARWYDPSIRRFTQKDIVHFTNRYIYVQNNPMNYIDPFGLFDEIILYNESGTKFEWNNKSDNFPKSLKINIQKWIDNLIEAYDNNKDMQDIFKSLNLSKDIFEIGKGPKLIIRLNKDFGENYSGNYNWFWNYIELDKKCINTKYNPSDISSWIFHEVGHWVKDITSGKKLKEALNKYKDKFGDPIKDAYKKDGTENKLQRIYNANALIDKTVWGVYFEFMFEESK